MAKPIEATPTLHGQDAINFVNDLIKVNSSIPTSAQIKVKNRVFNRNFRFIDNTIL
ncbi:MAG: hypothetical protein HRU03_04580 [Nanoarchaeales archaeon]|nr:hypothetical protein [Nanoarchaeales archaeon]